MQINGRRYLGFKGGDFSDKTAPESEFKKPETKEIRANSADALSNQGRAFVNISFKGNVSNPETPEIKELTDEEFEQLKAELEEKLKTLPADIREKINVINVSKLTKTNILVLDKILSDERLFGNEKFMEYAGGIIHWTRTSEQAQTKIDIIDKLLSDERLYNNENVMGHVGDIIYYTDTPEQVQLTDRILSDERLFGNENIIKQARDIICWTLAPEQAQTKISVIDKLLSDERLYNNENVMGHAGDIICCTNTPEQTQAKISVINKLLSDERLYNNENVMKHAGGIIYYTDTPEQVQLANNLLSDERLYNNEKFMECAGDIICYTSLPEDLDELFKLLDNKNLLPNLAAAIYLDRSGELTVEAAEKITKTMGIDKASKLSKDESYIAARFIDMYKRQNINELSIPGKRNLLRELVSSNTELFNLSDKMKEYFPILPANQEEYCSLLPSIVRSIGIEGKDLTDSEIKEFNKDINSLSLNLKDLSDEEFNNLEFKQEYNKDDFIKDVLDCVKDLEPNERQKVYDYFGFELHKNERTKTGYSITGYPVNLNNGKKLSEIKDNKTKEVVEKLRPHVIKFSEDNKVECGNKEIDNSVNKILKALPELRTTIGKVQAGNELEGLDLSKLGSHKFDVFKHSLKVMQKIVQSEEYNKLNESDKKIMLLASLLHDITKKEGYVDELHAIESSFDSSFVVEKFKLTQDEQIKLYDIIRHHEWLGYVNSNRINEETLNKRLQDTAYDLRYDNMLDMTLMFTHADLKAVKKDESFHDNKKGDSRIGIDGKIRSFGESADYFGEKIRSLIEELKPTQPLLPVTKIPKASRINEEITEVHSDGSTNIKGVYKDKNGLIILKYNELENEDLERIGFPKGSTVKGFKTKTSLGYNADTGNVKFFAHGLDYPNQLTKFDAFSLMDSDALLSVSYTELPESKYRFFRPQGVLLDCDTKYIHGGGETDSGSGYCKIVQEFKDNYIFGGEIEGDRKYVSDLIKEATGMNDSEYINFVKENENKPLSEIEPPKVREKIIKAFASINSNIRKGDRQYNEMYISNPKPPMAVFAYPKEEFGDERKDNPIDFLNQTNVTERTDFLQQYAIDRDIPLIVFGD